jgi:succinate dehydrogenase/fumarate reductase iron-sulfur protein
MSEAILRVFRGDANGGEEKEYKVPVEEGMVVLDALHYIEANYDHDLAVRWNCKAAKCGSCSTEINGKPQLACKSRMDKFAEGQPITVYPIKAFPLIKDLVTDVSWNYEVKRSRNSHRQQTKNLPCTRKMLSVFRNSENVLNALCARMYAISLETITEKTCFSAQGL